MIRHYVKKIITSPVFIICIGILLFLWISGCIDYLRVCKDNIIDVLYLIRVSAAFGVVLYMIPVITSLPFLTRYTEEQHNRIIYYQMIRANPKSYFRSQIICAVLSSLIMGVTSMVILFIISILAGAGFEVGMGNFFEDTCMYGLYHSSRMWMLYVWYCVLYILYGLPWTFFSLVISLVTKNKYILIAAPFVCCFGLSYIVEIVSVKWPVLIWVWPLQTILDAGLIFRDFWTMTHTVLYPVIYHLGLIVLLGGIYYCVSKRRFLREGA